ncbi:MAG: 1-(5-phosphoribosyl)-5-[(5-phosphoribosylamino)methylideneamino] imidazole-4-carboxamide isomerase [Ignavibacteriales bacterium]|nr:1-(5-phosphoribosyl)-5-[(5-phosphoribosylamino)methylideneamino] imidazole-4-carboxamide isomerase [Ignavibacteriales bacterium]
MLLVIPSIEILAGKCVRSTRSTSGELYSNDPIEMAKLWRKENAKSIHVTDLDAVRTGFPVNFDIIKSMVRTVDIPIELGGGLRTFNAVKDAMDNGIYRAVIGTMFIENPDEAKKCIDKFNASKVVLAIDAENFRTKFRDGADTGLTPISVALNAKGLGFRRIIYTDVIAKNSSREINMESIKLIAENTKMRITVSGGVTSLKDLLALQKLETIGVDSVIIGRALYENKFSCQQIWRMCEKGNYPYTARI